MCWSVHPQYRRFFFLFLFFNLCHLSGVRGAFCKLPDFFVQAFKIVVDSWKLSMFLLYILSKEVNTPVILPPAMGK